MQQTNTKGVLGGKGDPLGFGIWSYSQMEYAQTIIHRRE